MNNIIVFNGVIFKKNYSSGSVAKGTVKDNTSVVGSCKLMVHTTHHWPELRRRLDNFRTFSHHSTQHFTSMQLHGQPLSAVIIIT